MAWRRRRRPPGGYTTAAGSGGRRAPFSTDTATHTHTARSLACPLLTLSSSARPFSNDIFRSDGAPASLPPASSSLTHTRRMDGFCKQNADQLGSLAGLSFPAVYVGVVDCAPASPYTYSSSTHRFPDERTLIEATPLSATSAELVLGLGLGLELGSHSSSHAPSHAPLLLATLLSTQYPFPSRSLVRDGQTSPHMARLVVPHSTCPSLSPSPPRTQLYNNRFCSNEHTRPSETPVLSCVASERRRKGET
jgi:hypothetical protein